MQFNKLLKYIIFNFYNYLYIAYLMNHEKVKNIISINNK